jgi:hypothetical protein
MHTKYIVPSAKRDGTRNCRKQWQWKLHALLSKTHKFTSICEIMVNVTCSEGNMYAIALCHENSS